LCKKQTKRVKLGAEAVQSKRENVITEVKKANQFTAGF